VASTSTFPLVFTKDPETGIRNIGTYRMQVFRRPHDRYALQRTRAARSITASPSASASGLEVAVALSAEPVLPYCATAPMPEGLDELLLGGFLSKRRIGL